ncbi:hypothetical protein L6Q96_19905 [Candidatus Binatia bacterium]|nr:hypothetical protein [Candidatus Binatia bacterium]
MRSLLAGDQAGRIRTTRGTFDRGAAVLGFLVVVAANCRYLSGLTEILDPMTSMDPYYIHMARLPLVDILGRDASWGPLYALWLKPFAALWGDPLAVYAANVCGLSLGTSLLLYVYLAVVTRRTAIAGGAALLFLASDLNVPLYGKSSAFALMVVLAGFTVAEICPAGARRASVATVGVLLASYARPELYPGAVVLCLFAVWRLRGELGGEGSGTRLLWPAGAVLAFATAAVVAGAPLPTPGGRLLLAFQEHFAWNWSRWHGGWLNVFAVWEREFGGAATMLGAVTHNPGAVARHLFDNLHGTVRYLAVSAFAHYPVLAPVTAPGLIKGETVLVSVAALGVILAAVARRGWRRAFVTRYGESLFEYAAVGAWCLASAVVVFPLAYYLVIPGVLLLAAGALAATVVFPARARLSWGVRVVAVSLCLAAVPTPFVLPSAYEVRGSPFMGEIAVRRRLTDTVRFIRALELAGPVQVLTLTDGVGEMLGSGFNEVKVWQKGNEPLAAYMRDRDIGVVVNLEGGRDSFRVNDPYWRRFQDDPEAAGFALLAVPGHETVAVYVRRDLMPR